MNAKVTRAPGRVNLIGEHTDYTGGLVLPIAIPYATEAATTAAEGVYRFTTSASHETWEQPVGAAEANPTGEWTDYPAGVLYQLLKSNISVPPFSIHFSGNVPLSAGLSSSASIEVATALALLQHSNSTMLPGDIALLCQRAENQYVNSPCGIMDQYVVTAATLGHALLIHTRDLQAEQIPMDTGDLANCSIIVANSMVKHSVATGDYGVRRRELEEGQAILRERFPQLRDLGDAIIDQLVSCEAAMQPNVFKRCKHVVTENARVLAACEAMRKGDAATLGTAMTASHASQRDDFEDSVEEIDFLVETALQQPGCYGARLTGGGFGGCTVNLVATEHVPAFTSALSAAYQQRFGIVPEIYPCHAAAGAVALLSEATA